MSGSRIRLYGSTSGYVELEAPAVAPDGVLTLPTGTGGFGKTLQVVQTVKTDTFSASVAVGALSGDITGLTATITPTATASKVLVIVSLAGARSANGTVAATLFRDIGGAGAARIANGADSSNRVGASWIVGKADNDTEYGTSTFAFLDSPSTTSATTYSVRLSHFANGTLTWESDDPKPTKKTLDDAWPRVESDRKWREVRAERDSRLSASDWSQMPDNALAAPAIAEWAAYRQQLRDIPQTFDDPDAVVWPEVP